MTNSLMTASHAAGKGSVPDAVFAVLQKANAAIAAIGKDKVVNASIGTIYDEDEKFTYFSTVLDYLHQAAPEEMMNYAPISGLPEFLSSAIDQVFQGNQPENTFAKAIATPGGTGAIRHVFVNYLEPGQKALVPDWFWGNYRTIAEEHMRSIETFTMFDEENKFNIPSLKEKVVQLLTAQDNLVIVFNSPAHNPTGYSLTEKEWNEVIDFLKECAGDKHKKITVLLDIAYIDYAGEAQATRKFFRLFNGLPKNLFLAIAYSMSKSFLIYGMRSGALVGLSSSEEVIEEFSRVNAISNRGVWSNGTRGAQRLLVDVTKNPELKAKIEKERAGFRELMNKRAVIFMEEAKEVGLKTFPYQSGFFITVPAPNPQAATAKLTKDHIYALHLKKGIRVAICGIPTYKIPGIATKIKDAL
ncbi:MAG: aminotransferase class I/II-fold pyridoxal phosphate-dependent enzyme [Bacillota bacterium]|nr:aminotransferase class I/II-fold pyridoxal phosphate-dependent enzyme [Clostridia bacterium]